MLRTRRRSIWLGLFLFFCLALLLAAILYPMVLHLRGFFTLRPLPMVVWFAAALGYTGLLAALVGGAYLALRQRAQLAAQESNWRVQEQAIQAMREERHDVLNELTLAMSYLEVGRIQEARQVLEYLSVTLSDRFQTNTLPEDAWLTIIRIKGAEASRRGIRFETHVQGSPPARALDKRLLPRIIGNLLDNAFDAASEDPKPHVVLIWDQVESQRQLVVKNNGQSIPQQVGSRVFEPGYTTKGNNGRGWGLAICRRMADQLNGRLTYQSQNGYTVFRLVLPAASKDT